MPKPRLRWHSQLRHHRYDASFPERDELRFRGQLDGMTASWRHRHSNSDLWPIPKSDTEKDLPTSPCPSEIGEPATDDEQDAESNKACDTGGADPRQLSRRHTLPSLDDHGRSRLCPFPSAKSRPQTYTAVTFHTPGTVFTTGSSKPSSVRTASTHSTIVCGEKNWMAHVDWETASMISAPPDGRRASSATQHVPFSDGGNMDRGRMTESEPSIHPRHHSTAGLVSVSPDPRRHPTDPDTASVLSVETPSPLTLDARERANSETPFISAVSLWSPRNLFASASGVERRATVHDSRPRQARRDLKDKTPELRGAAWSLRKLENARANRERTMVPPGLDNAGIYEAMTGSKLVRGLTLPCDEDHRPHVCLHELSDESE